MTYKATKTSIADQANWPLSFGACVDIVTYGVIFNMSRVWVRGKILVPDMNRTHDLPYTGRVLLLLSYWETRGERGHLLVFQ